MRPCWWLVAVDIVLDMGQPVLIKDFAEQMISLSGLKPKVDIEIVYTGLRPGEKLYEELLTTEENTIPTHHQKILIGKVKEYQLNEVKNSIQELIKLYASQDNERIVKKMKEIVPEFLSNNSIFSKFDQ